MTVRNIWTPVLNRGGKPAYLEIADAIAADIQDGRLRANDPLPPQRLLAQKLDLNFSTISRAYAEAQRRGLIVSRVGQGTVVCPAPSQAEPQLRPVNPVQIDMTMNLPPEPDQPDLVARMQNGLHQLKAKFHVADLLRYQAAGGSLADRQAGADWLSPLFPGLQPHQIVVCPGAQSALAAVLTSLVQPGETVCCEDLTFTSFRSLAAHMGVRLVGLPMDDQGIDAAAFANACRDHAPKALYLNPTLQNPTTVTVSETRRKWLIQIARHHNVPIIEDDAYGMLPIETPPPFAVLASDLTYHIAGLSKCLGAGLRLSYLIAPNRLAQSKLLAALRVVAGMASPVTAALAATWIADGTAAAMRDFIRRESQARQAIAAAILPQGSYDSHPQAFHLWLKLPPLWSRGQLSTHLRGVNLGVVTSDAFAVTDIVPDAVRICMGGPLDQNQVRDALMALVQTISQDPALYSAVI